MSRKKKGKYDIDATVVNDLAAATGFAHGATHLLDDLLTRVGGRETAIIVDALLANARERLAAVIPRLPKE